VNAGVVIHPGLLEMLASAGHLDELLICDAGYPVPAGIPRIDLGYRAGQAPFLDVLAAVATTIPVERASIATEADSTLGTAIAQVLGFEADRIEHVSLKRRALECRGAVRTGEYTRYANVVLTVGVPF
jgi:D-ribose pyranase